jgi:ribosomal-protein-alanine N-acetyltransferase
MRIASPRATRNILRGKRVILRRPRAADEREFILLVRRSAPVYGVFAPPFKSKARFNDFLRRCRRDDHRSFMICRNTDGVIVGNIGLSHIILRSLRSAFVGYFVGADHSRQGYATEAMQLVLRFAFNQLKLHRVEASIQPRNAPSLALVKRAGFTREGYSRRYLKIAGRWRDHERWAILAEEWHPLRAA